MGWHEAAACGGRLAKKKGKKGGGAGGAGGGKGGSAAADLEGLEPEELLQALLADVRESMDRKVAGLKSELTKLRGSGASPSEWRWRWKAPCGACGMLWVALTRPLFRLALRARRGWQTCWTTWLWTRTALQLSCPPLRRWRLGALPCCK